MQKQIRYIFAIIVFAFFPLNFVWGQEQIKFYRGQIKISPVRIVDPVNSGIEFSYERYHGNCSSTQISAAFMIDLFDITAWEKFYGGSIAVEKKYFIRRRAKKVFNPLSFFRFCFL
ncbi:MAG: hypothetical protein LBH92_03775 [Bacteroidales bacterium]|jgi:hypothetical protein|nr:hypothetical protein [Bacteroidales bacterium]